MPGLKYELNIALNEAAERLDIFIFKETFILGPIIPTENYLYIRYSEKMKKTVEKVINICVGSDIIDVDFSEKTYL